MDSPADPGLAAVLVYFGVGSGDLLGHGGEAWVYALDDTRVLRVLHNGGRIDHVAHRRRLIDELARSRPAFGLPAILEVGELDGRTFAVERRLPGRSVMEALHNVEGRDRARLIEVHLDAAAALGDLHLEPRDYFGDLIADDPIRAPTWREYLCAKAAANLKRSIAEFASIDPTALADAFPDTTEPAFVHLDAFAANMLTDGERITAVLDIGVTSAIGDRRLDAVAAAVYLTAPQITPTAKPDDIDICASWLRAACLLDWFEPTRRWLAAYWSFAVDDPRVLEWCRAVLLPESR